MNKYSFFYLFWLLPAYLLFLTIHQVWVYTGLTDTYQHGSSYTAEVTEFEIKQIASQTNGYVILRFNTDSGDTVQQKLTLPIELASMISDLKVIPVRYRSGAFENLVLMPTYPEHRRMVLSNAVMSGIGLLIALFIAIVAHRFASKKISEEDRELVIERVE